MTDSDLDYECIHCGRSAQGTQHLTRGHLGKQRCAPDESGLPYGYNAHPIGTACRNPCIGEWT